MGWKFVIGVIISGDVHSLGIMQAPTIIVNPFHESITYTWLSLHGELLPVFIENFVSRIDNQSALFDDILNCLNACLHALIGNIRIWVRLDF